MVKALALLVLMVWGQATAPGAAAEKADVCAVAKSSAQFAGHYVELTGTVLGQDTDHLLLTSPDCMFGVKLVFTPEVRAHEDVAILFAAIKRNAAMPDRKVTATFEGTFVSTEGGLQVAGIDQLNFPKK